MDTITELQNSYQPHILLTERERGGVTFTQTKAIQKLKESSITQIEMFILMEGSLV